MKHNNLNIFYTHIQKKKRIIGWLFSFLLILEFNYQHILIFFQNNKAKYFFF